METPGSGPHTFGHSSIGPRESNHHAEGIVCHTVYEFKIVTIYEPQVRQGDALCVRKYSAKRRLKTLVIIDKGKSRTDVGKCTHQCEETQGNNSAQALSTKKILLRV